VSIVSSSDVGAPKNYGSRIIDKKSQSSSILTAFKRISSAGWKSCASRGARSIFTHETQPPILRTFVEWSYWPAYYGKTRLRSSFAANRSRDKPKKIPIWGKILQMLCYLQLKSDTVCFDRIFSLGINFLLKPWSIK